MKILPHCGIDMLVYLASVEQDKKVKRQKLLMNQKSALPAVLKDICQVFNVDIVKVIEGDQHEGPELCRDFFSFICRRKTKSSFLTIAKQMGCINHSSAFYHHKKVKGFLKIKDPDFMPYWNYYLENSKLFTKKDFR